MHVAINARFLLPNKLEGIGRVSHELLFRLVKQQPDWRFTFLFDRAYDTKYIYDSNVDAKIVFPPARHPLLYVAYFEWSLPLVLKRIKPDIFFSPDGYLSLSLSNRIPQIPLFHDLAFEHFPEYVGSRPGVWHYQWFFRRYARKAAHILAVSEYTKNDIIKQYHCSANHITVIPNAAGTDFHPVESSEISKTTEQYTHGRPYFIYAGAIQPRKNLINLLKAFELFKYETQHPAILILTGRKAWNFERIIAFYKQMQHKTDVFFTGYISDEELNKLYAGALALCYVSHFEGFGLPILEAMQAGTAIIYSNVSAMPEVAGAAGIAIDPQSPESIAQAMKKIAFDPVYRRQLIEYGKVQQTRFNWESSAAKLAQILLNYANK